MGKQETNDPGEIVRFSMNLFEVYDKIAAARSLPASAFWVMYLVSKTDKVYMQQEICTRWSFPKQTINSAIKWLVKRKYIYLEQGTYPFARRKNIKLTAEGKIYASRLFPALYQAEMDALANLTEAEREMYLALANKYLTYLRQSTAEFTNL